MPDIIEKTIGAVTKVGPRVKRMPEGMELHHNGRFNTLAHCLSRPIWVSDCRLHADWYVGFYHLDREAPPLYYSRFQTAQAIRLADMGNTSMCGMCQRAGLTNHGQWNAVLSAGLTAMGYDGLVSHDREILIAEPHQTLRPLESTLNMNHATGANPSNTGMGPV